MKLITLSILYECNSYKIDANMASSYKSFKKVTTFIELEDHDNTRDFSELKK